MKGDNDLIAKVRGLIEENKNNLSLGEYHNLKGIIGKAERSLRRRNLTEYLSSLEGLIDKLSNIDPTEEDLTKLIRDITDCFEGLKTRLSDFSRRITAVDNTTSTMFDDYRPISFRDILNSLCKPGTEVTMENGTISFTPGDNNILEREVNACEDDGMGYCAVGPQRIFSAYQDKESGNINLWF